MVTGKRVHFKDIFIQNRNTFLTTTVGYPESGQLNSCPRLTPGRDLNVQTTQIQQIRVGLSCAVQNGKQMGPGVCQPTEILQSKL